MWEDPIPLNQCKKNHILLFKDMVELLSKIPLWPKFFSSAILCFHHHITQNPVTVPRSKYFAHREPLQAFPGLRR